MELRLEYIERAKLIMKNRKISVGNMENLRKKLKLENI